MLGQRPAVSIEVHAPAKLNLFLEVLAKRDDGYHEIETLMVPVNLFDTLHFHAHDSASKNVVDFSYRHFFGRQFKARDDVPVGRENIIFRAIELLRRRAGVDAGAQVFLIKRVPVQSGLGGGSSDAAAALVAANRAWQLGWTESRLVSLAAELGSDVPFFIERHPAICRGRGERIESVNAIGDLHAVIIYPPGGLSTAEVYSRCRAADRPCSASELVDALGTGCPEKIRKAMLNRLQPAAEELSPWICRARDEFNKTDCAAHQLTGSGSAYFGICRNAQHARRVAALVRARTRSHVFTVRRTA